ncbi:carbohydrate binding domain-containing protein [Paenibacillus sp. J5C_2022]|nr:carbohydrate binding domain-containing protein [Paenibacillus sp. J5C2022]
MRKKAILCVLLCVLIWPQLVWGADTSVDELQQYDQPINFGRGVSESPDGGALAWGESYYLKSYMNMYDATGDKVWLDKMTDHFDRMLLNAWDHNGDGYKGWPDIRYAHNQVKNGQFAIEGSLAGDEAELLMNGSFEVDSDLNGIPDGWQQEGNPLSGSRSVLPDDVFHGSAGFILESDGAQTNRLVQQLDYVPGETYVVEGFSGVDTEKTQAKIEIYHEAGNKVLGYVRIHHVGYERQVFTFQAPQLGAVQLRLSLEHYDQPGYKARFDQLSVKPVRTSDSDGGGFPLLLNGGFEDVDSQDSTMPEHWSRWSNSVSQNVYLTSDAYAGDYAFAVTTDASSWEIAEQEISYTPSEKYTVSFHGKVLQAAGAGRVEAYNATDNIKIKSVLFNQTDWQALSFTFTAPEQAGKQLKIRIYQSNWQLQGFTSIVDELTVTPYQPQLLMNEGMEAVDSADPTMPEHWSRWSYSVTDNVYRSGADAHSGNYALAVTTDNTSWEVAEQTIGYEPGETYAVQFWSKVLGTAAGGKVQIYNATDNVMLATTTFYAAEWKPYTFTFTAPNAEGKLLKLRLLQTDWQLNGHTVLYDDFSMSKVLIKPALLENGGFQFADSQDSTMAASWSRTSGANASDVYVTEALNTYYTGNKGLAITIGHGASQQLNTESGTKYVLQYRGRTSRPDESANVDIFNVTDQTILASAHISGPSWQKRALVFTAPHEKMLELRLHATGEQSSGNDVYYDDIAINEVVATLPAGWQLLDTDVAQAHRTNDTSVYYEGGATNTNDWVLELLHDGVSESVITQQLHNYVPNVPYAFAITGRVSDGATGTIRARDLTTGIELASASFQNNEKFERISAGFTTPAEGHDIRLEIALSGGSSGDKLYAYDAMGGQLWEQMVHEGIIIAPVLRFVKAIYDDETLHEQYLSRADAYRDFVVDNLVHKWDPYWKQISGIDGANNGRGTYIFPPGFSTEWFPSRSLPHNQYLAYAVMLHLLYDVTEDAAEYAAERPLYLSRANDMNRTFKETLREHPLNASLGTDAYLWNYWDNLGVWDDGHYYTSNQEDMSHAALTLTGPLEAYAYNQVFDAEDMVKLTHTFTDIMWNQSLVDPVLSWYNSRQPAYTVDQIRTRQFHHWMDFAQFDPVVWEIGNAVCETGLCSNYIASGVAKWSRNKVVNGGFEFASPASSSLPGYWTASSSAGTGDAIYRSSTEAYRGAWSVAIPKNGPEVHRLQYRMQHYEPNTTYELSFFGKTDGRAMGRIEVVNETDQEVLKGRYFRSEEWSGEQLTFRTPEAAGKELYISFAAHENEHLDGIVYVDEVRAYPSLHRSQLPNSGFETADRWDEAWPRYWRRGETTEAGLIQLDASVSQAGSQSLRLESAASGAEQEAIYEWTGYLPGSIYQLSAYGKAEGSSEGSIQVMDTATNELLAEGGFSDSEWRKLCITFAAPAEHDHKLKVIITHDDPSQPDQTLWVDEIGIVQAD